LSVYFSAKGRIGRLAWLSYYLLMIIIIFVSIYVFGFVALERVHLNRIRDSQTF
jgi:uncharacterized membrane protein YhaH (DUF805 family)